MRFSDDVIERLTRSQWWEYAFPQFAGLDFLDPIKFCQGLEELKEHGLQKFNPDPLTFDGIVECYNVYTAYQERINRASELAKQHWVLRRVLKQFLDKKKYKKLKTDPDKFFADSKSGVIRFLGNFYN